MKKGERLVSNAASRLLHRSFEFSDVKSSTLDRESQEVGLLISRWTEWSDLHEKRAEDSKKLKALEAELVSQAKGFRRIEISSSSGGSAFVTSNAEIDRHLPAHEHSEENAQAKAALATRQSAWTRADADVGYSTAYALDATNSDTEIEMAEAIWRTPAMSLAAIVAKLHCLIEMENPDGCLNETPWPQLLSILSDLVSLYARGSE